MASSVVVHETEEIGPNPEGFDPDLQTVNGYSLTRLLGKGAFAKVFECCQTASSDESVAEQQLYAMKVFDKQAIRKIQFVRPGCGNIDRELEVWSRVSGHPNISSLKAIIKDPSSRYVRAVMEHAAGGELMPDSTTGEVSKVLPLAIIRRVAAQLLDALTHCHALLVTHRDTKPSNLLLKAPIPEELSALLDEQRDKGSPLPEEKQSRLKTLLSTSVHVQLCDFGEAMDVALTASTTSDYTRQTTGSPAFNAPEMLSSSLPFSTAKQDAWAAGMTLFMLLHGRPAFMSDHLVGLHEAIRDDDLAWEPLRRPATTTATATTPGTATGTGIATIGGDFAFDGETDGGKVQTSWGDLDDETNPLAWRCAEDLVRRLLTKDPYNRWSVRKARCSHPFVKDIEPMQDPVPEQMKGKALVGEETERPEHAGGGAGSLPASDYDASSLPPMMTMPLVMSPMMPPVMMKR